MKQLIVPVAIIVVLIAFFVVIDRKEFSRNDDVQTVQREPPTSNRKPLVYVPETKPATKSKPAAETTLVEKKTVEVEANPVTEVKPKEETKPAETAEVKLVETKPASETKPVTKPKPVAEKNEEKPVPFAVTVATPEEAERLNKEALAEFEIFGKRSPKDQERSERGYRLVFSDQFKKTKSVTLTKANEEQIAKKSYVLDDFKGRKIPNDWSIDYATIPSNTILRTAEDGFTIVSDQGAIRLIGQHMDAMSSSFIFELTLKNNSDKEGEITLGVHNSGILKRGYRALATETIPGKEEKTIEVELSVFEQMASIAPTISVKGTITLADFKIYRKDHDNFTIVEGEITERSTLPAPDDTDYPDCRYTAHFVGNLILSGLPCNKELALSIDGFLKKQVLPTNSLKVGDKIKCAIVPVESLPDEIASIQEADDLSLFELDSYYVTTYSPLSSYTNPLSNQLANTFVNFKSDVLDYQSVFNRGFNPPIPDTLKDAQKERIKKDLADIDKKIAYLKENREELEQKFQDAWSKEKKQYSDSYNTIKNKDGSVSLYWRKVNNSFWCLPPRYTLVPSKVRNLSKDNLDALVAFKDFLESNGIQLVVALIPESYTISSRIINSEFKDVPILELAALVKQLSEAGIECPYTASQIIKNYNLYPFAYLFPNDSHPGSTVHQSISEILADRLSGSMFPRSLSRDLFTHIPSTSQFDDVRTPHVFPQNCDIGNNTAGSLYPVDIVYYDGEMVKRDALSEILVVGNSYIHSPSGKQHSFFAMLSESLLYPVDEILSYGYGPMTTVIQRFLEKPELYLRNKKKVILVYGTNTFLKDSVPWNNISDMDSKRLMLNGKKLVATLQIPSNAKTPDNLTSNQAWNSFPNKSDVFLTDDTRIEIYNQAIPNIDTSKPLVCTIETVRLPNSPTPVLFVNDIAASVPATNIVDSIYWQNIYYPLPQGTNQLKIEIQGKKNTIIGFNKITIYQ